LIDDIEQEQEGWVNRLSNEDTKVWAKSSGSKYDKTNPIVKCEYIFRETNDPLLVFESVNILSPNMTPKLVHENSQAYVMG
jgi:hypothetical protein